MLFTFSAPVLIRRLWQLKTVVFLHWCIICAVLLRGVYAGMKTINTCHWQLRFETDFSILKLHRSAKSPTHIACVYEPLKFILC